MSIKQWKKAIKEQKSVLVHVVDEGFRNQRSEKNIESNEKNR